MNTTSTENWNQNGNKNRNRNRTHAAKAPQSPYVCVRSCVCLSVKSEPAGKSYPTPCSRQSRSSFEYAARNDFVLAEIAALITQQQRQCDRLQRACWYMFEAAIEKFHFYCIEPFATCCERTRWVACIGCVLPQRDRRAARRRNAFTNSIAIQPSFEAVQALAISL